MRGRIRFWLLFLLPVVVVVWRTQSPTAALPVALAWLAVRITIMQHYFIQGAPVQASRRPASHPLAMASARSGALPRWWLLLTGVLVPASWVVVLVFLGASLWYRTNPGA